MVTSRQTDNAIASVTTTGQTEPLNQEQLAKRLSCNPSSVNRKRAKPIFHDWSRARDPEGMGWIFNDEDKLFYPVE
ncbi:hypothetical protein [Crinalium epipsammum]|uniref:hypothetical protein n=1 Tax=Crinalium epipsammum TaxID=241425 RepID=UPI00059D694F|nr:hypothetical protein [Crinalium epipsammum]